MAAGVNTIQLFLLENKSIQTKFNGLPYTYEGSYNIVAGDLNATEFEIASVPNKYRDYAFSVNMTNSRGQNVLPPSIVNNRFSLPVGMAVAGYGQLVISAHGADDDGNSVTAYFLPLKIKVSNTAANWTSGVVNGTIAISRAVTLPPDSKAYAINIGTPTDAIIELGIPEGKGFVIDKTYSSIAEMNAGFSTDDVRLYGFAIIDTGNVEDEDNAKLFIKTETEYKYLTDLSGAQGIKGDKGDPGIGILKIVSEGQDKNGGNKYRIMLTNGDSYPIIAPKGDKGTGISDVQFVPDGENPAPTPEEYAVIDGDYPNMTVGKAINDGTGTNIADHFSDIESLIPTTATPDNKLADQASVADKYTKPESGIPESDLSADVQEKLNGSSGAVSSVNGQTGAVEITPENIGAVNKSGDTLEGAFKLDGFLSSPDWNSQIRILPVVDYEEIDPTHTTEVYLKELLKWICRNYPNSEHNIWIGNARPNSVGCCIIGIYNTSDVNNEGLPRHSNGLFRNINADLWTFYTQDYNYGYSVNSNALPLSGGTLTGDLKVQSTYYPAVSVIEPNKDIKGILECNSSGSEFNIDLVARRISTNTNLSNLRLGDGYIDAKNGELREGGQRVYSPNNLTFTVSGSTLEITKS